MKASLFLIAALASLPFVSAQAPPPIPSGPVAYSSISAPAPSVSVEEVVEATSYTSTEALPTSGGVVPAEGALPVELPVVDANALADPTAALNPAGPILETTSDFPMWDLDLNLYTSNYNVRGMGVTNRYSDDGFSSIALCHTGSNRNLFNYGIQHRIHGEVGFAWGDGEALNDGLMSQWGYAMGKEIFPNLIAEFGYNLRYGTLEGYMAKQRGKAPHSLAQDLALTLRFDDKQKGFFGGAQLGYGFYGLTGWFYDLSVGYRQTEVLTAAKWGLDVELSVGMAGSSGYWTGNADGIDAYRFRATFLPYMHEGDFGRDGQWKLAPWIEFAVSGSNDSEIDRSFPGLVDSNQITVGVELSWQF